MRLNVRAFALACALIWGLGLFAITWWIIFFEGQAPADAAPPFLGLIYRGYEFTTVGSLIDDDDIVGRGASQTDVLGGIRVTHPMVALPAVMEHLHIGQIFEDLAHLASAEIFFRSKRQFESGALEVAHEDDQVIRVQ